MILDFRPLLYQRYALAYTTEYAPPTHTQRHGVFAKSFLYKVITDLLPLLKGKGTPEILH
jgi:hypothetical protein